MKALKIVAGVIIVLGALMVLYVTFPQVRTLLIGGSIKAVYTNTDYGTSVNVVYDQGAKTATLDSRSYHGVVLSQTVSADGARYENKDQGLVLWNKGDKVTLYKNDTIIFTGEVSQTPAK